MALAYYKYAGFLLTNVNARSAAHIGHSGDHPTRRGFFLLVLVHCSSGSQRYKLFLPIYQFEAHSRFGSV